MDGINNGMDLYNCFKLPIYATETEITNAFRRQVSLCHPDKYPDDKQKAEIFRALCKAFAILTDPEARDAYDKVLRAKAVNSIIYSGHEFNRLKILQDEKYKLQQKSDELRMEYEISRIVEMGSASLERELQRFEEDRNLLFKEIEESKDEWNSPNKVKIHWHSRAKSDIARHENAVFTSFKKKTFHDIAPNGEIKSLVKLPYSDGTIVEFVTKNPVIVAAEKEREKALAYRYKSLKWSDGRPVSFQVNNLQDVPRIITKEQQEMDAITLQAILNAAQNKRRKDELTELIVSKYRIKTRFSLNII